MLRTRKINLGTFRGALISAFLAMFLVAGCDLITVEEAQETLETAREIQQIQDEEIRPRLAALEDFQGHVPSSGVRVRHPVDVV